eukprot:ANDGO_02633.mRNA.1 Putative white-brown complex homolog protein 30
MNGVFQCNATLSCGNPFCTVSSSFPCSPGFICPKDESIQPCPSGHYCPSYSLSSAIECKQGTWCPKYSKVQIDCEPGSYCPAGSERQLEWLGLVATTIMLIAAAAVVIVTLRLRNKQRQSRENRRHAEVAGRAKGSVTGVSSANSPSNVVTRTRLDIRFEDIFYEIPVSVPLVKKVMIMLKKEEKPFKVLMNHVSGECKAGQFTAIMGPSGAGKTTLMTILAGKVKKTAGQIFINNKPVVDVSEEAAKHGFGFVPQDDIMHTELSAKEVLIANADMRLPPMETLRRHAIVNEVLDQLDLEHVKHVIVGNEADGKRGISGGQRKRVNIGMEIVPVPSALFLDEPTSGLDSSAAESVCGHLAEIAHNQGVNVVAVIHQPRNEIFSMFDQLILLAPGGRVAYAGPPQAIKEYLAGFGYICPLTTNVPDYMMDVVAGKATTHDGKLINLGDAWIEHVRAQSGDSQQSKGQPQSSEQGKAFSSLEALREKPSPLFQFVVMLRRAIVLCYRNWMSVLVQCIMHFLAGIIVGLAFTTGQVFTPPISSEYVPYCPSVVSKYFCEFPILDVSGALNDYCVMALGLTAVSTGVRTFGKERVIAWREASVGVNIVSYLSSRWLVDIALLTLYSLCYCVSLNLVSSLQGAFMAYWLVFAMTEWVVFAFGYCLSAFMRVKNATLVGVICCLAWVVADGGVYTVQTMGLLGSFSYPRWTAEAIFLTEINYDDLSNADQKLLKTYLDKYEYGWKIGNYGVDIGALFLLGLMFRSLHLLLYWICNRQKRK